MGQKSPPTRAFLNPSRGWRPLLSAHGGTTIPGRDRSTTPGRLRSRISCFAASDPPLEPPRFGPCVAGAWGFLIDGSDCTILSAIGSSGASMHVSHCCSVAGDDHCDASKRSIGAVPAATPNGLVLKAQRSSDEVHLNELLSSRPLVGETPGRVARARNVRDLCTCVSPRSAAARHG